MADKIKYPVRAYTDNGCNSLIISDDGFVTISVDPACRDELICILNNYDVAVAELKYLLTMWEGDNDPSGYHQGLIDTLKTLGELDDGNDTSGEAGAKDQDGGGNSGVSLQAGGDGAVSTGGKDGIGGQDQEEAGGVESGPGGSDSVTCAYSDCNNMLFVGDGPICLRCEKREDHGREMQAEIDNDPSGKYFKEDGDG